MPDVRSAAGRAVPRVCLQRPFAPFGAEPLPPHRGSEGSRPGGAVVIEVRHELAVAVCANCWQAITLTTGDLTREQWHHDDTGQQRCHGAPVATPLTGSIQRTERSS
jgi:hypothetical protein